MSLPDVPESLPTADGASAPGDGAVAAQTPGTGPSTVVGLTGAVIDHVGIAVAELEPAIRFYVEVLGGQLRHRERNDEQGVEEAMLSFGDGAEVQLLAPTGPQSPIAAFLDKRGPGLQQLALRVPDLAAATAALAAAGIRLLYDKPRRGTAGSAINFVHPRDAGGLLIELVAPAWETG